MNIYLYILPVVLCLNSCTDLFFSKTDCETAPDRQMKVLIDARPVQLKAWIDTSQSVSRHYLRPDTAADERGLRTLASHYALSDFPEYRDKSYELVALIPYVNREFRDGDTLKRQEIRGILFYFLHQHVLHLKVCRLNGTELQTIHALNSTQNYLANNDIHACADVFVQPSDTCISYFAFLNPSEAPNAGLRKDDFQRRIEQYLNDPEVLQ